MLKQNARELLILIAHQNLRMTGIPVDFCYSFFDQLTASGVRSLLDHLLRKGYVWRERHAGRDLIGCTGLGSSTVQSQFPALFLSNTDQLTWTMVLLIKSPPNDSHFRSLARRLQKNRLLRLSTGVYLHPVDLPHALRHEIETLYRGHVIICTVNDWIFGLDRPLIVSYYDLQELSTIYSGISKEINQVLGTLNVVNGLTVKQYSIVRSIVKRMEAVAAQDNGLLASMFPDAQTAKKCFDQLSDLVKRISTNV